MESPSTMLVRLPERFSGAEARALASELDGRLLSDQPCLIVDLSRVKQIDSTGLDMLLRCMVKVARQDGSVQLGEISPEAAAVLEFTRMDRMFDMFPRISEDNATLRVIPASVGFEETEEKASVEEAQPMAA
jgi:anti-anti-sigma factor